ncbi:transposase [Marivirga harenae]|uniref:transposase n=1 Tax=Marivirga harenae TaxID=2010992 RepID=UPI0026DFF7C3|nr:transposase [Marivirga harenae]WKV12471.1 transposase [Marivirga harenae]|tara:strand:+ start:59598 stop:60242 length:645 start_codon:yes stop_codon:yes gene_type:complete
MSEKFKNTYRTASARRQKWDYRWDASYFVTICTKDRHHFFGEIIDGKMQLSHQGILANVFWHEIPHHAISVHLDEFVVMPNHIHGILVLQNGFPPPVYFEVFDFNSLWNDGADNGRTGYGRDNACIVSTPTEMNNPEILTGKTRFQNPGKNSISSIIGSYKSAVTKHANRLNLENGWQTRFHDHIIRTKEEYYRIKKYIRNNTKNWEEDRFFEN